MGQPVYRGMGQTQADVMAADPGLQDETPLAVGGKLLLIGLVLLILSWKR